MARTILECWDLLNSPLKATFLASDGNELGSRIYEYLAGTGVDAGSGRGQESHQFDQRNINEWTAKNNKIRNDSTVETTTVIDLLGL